MTLYAGETVRISGTATKLDGETKFTPADGVAGELTVWDAEGVALLGPVAMSWDAAALEWFYDWGTDAQPAGAYDARVRVHGGGVETWEYLKIRLKADPHA